MVGWTNVLGTLTPKHVHRIFQFRLDVQTRRDASRTVEDRVLIGGHICGVDWHNNG